MTISKHSTVSALISLLEDDDKQVSTLAMEELLTMDQELDALVAELQESTSPILRSRIHQIGNILNIRRARMAFIDKVKTGQMSLWDGLLQINYQYNPRMGFASVDKAMSELTSRLPKRPNSARIAAFMRNEGFTHPVEDVLGADLYLVEDALIQRVGSPILLSVLARHLGEQCGWHSTLVLYRGKHCLVDGHYNLLEPAEGWRISPLNGLDKQHPCGDRDVWLTVLSQLFLAALMEGSLQAIHRMGNILALLSGGEFDLLPFPLGERTEHSGAPRK
jgi:hypothetical protein